MLKQNGSSRNWYMLLVIKVPKIGPFISCLKLRGMSLKFLNKVAFKGPLLEQSVTKIFVTPRDLTLQNIWPSEIFVTKWFAALWRQGCWQGWAQIFGPKYLNQIFGPNIWTKIFVPETFVPKWFATLWRQGCWQGFCPHSLFFLQFWLITRGAGNEWG